MQQHTEASNLSENCHHLSQCLPRSPGHPWPRGAGGAGHDGDNDSNHDEDLETSPEDDTHGWHTMNGVWGWQFWGCWFLWNYTTNWRTSALYINIHFKITLLLWIYTYKHIYASLKQTKSYNHGYRWWLLQHHVYHLLIYCVSWTSTFLWPSLDPRCVQAAFRMDSASFGALNNHRSQPVFADLYH